jgi:hypothetical protein
VTGLLEALAAFLALTVGATLALAALTAGATRVAIAALLAGTFGPASGSSSLSRPDPCG